MFRSTLSHLQCLHCQNQNFSVRAAEADDRGDILWGTVLCQSCDSQYPILAGVLLYAVDIEHALVQHIKGISALVPDERIPDAFAESFFAAREELRADGFFNEGLEEDLEAERVNALYVMNHFLESAQVPKTANPVLDEVIEKHWNHGPLEKTSTWITELLENSSRPPSARLVEFGCSVGGLAQKLAKQLDAYLGIDASFTSVALARHLALGAPYPFSVRIPGDLIQGPVSIYPQLPQAAWTDDRADFILGDLHDLALVPGSFDFSVALGLLDMLDEPGVLVFRQKEALAPGGTAIQAGPSIWHEPVARALRERFSDLPVQELSSATVVKALYENLGLKLVASFEAIPWVFFKHVRQIEVYSVYWAAFCSLVPTEPDQGATVDEGLI